jgi:UDP-3-O-acyl N-acetylglucosamine deacetylase
VISSESSPRVTLDGPAEVRGVGLFTGAPSVLRFLPAPAGAGITFRRADSPDAPRLPADLSCLVSEPRRTVLSPRPADRSATARLGVQTVEHVLSALAAAGITDALIEVSAPETPIGDGSALPFIEAISRAGVCALPGEVEPIVVRDALEVEIGAGGRIVATPGDVAGLELVYHLDYGPGAPIAPHTARWFCPAGGDAAAYTRDIAPARTFSTLAEATAMRATGLFTHLSPRDMLVVGPDGPVENAYRFPDEPARHKLLDLLGDLSLAGRPVRGRVEAWRSGHALNHAIAARLAALT